MAPTPRQEDKLFSKVAGIYFDTIILSGGLEKKISSISNATQKIGKDFLLESVVSRNYFLSTK